MLWLSVNIWRHLDLGARQRQLLLISLWAFIILSTITLFKPALHLEKGSKLTPAVIVLHDRSNSMNTRDQQTSGHLISRSEFGDDFFRQLQSDPKFANITWLNYTFAGNGLHSPDSMDLGDGSDLGLALEQAHSIHPMARATLLLSDGDHNRGLSLQQRDFRLKESSAPILAMVSGTNTAVHDTSIVKIRPPAYTLLGERTAMLVTLQNSFPHAVDTQLQLLRDGKHESMENLSLAPGHANHHRLMLEAHDLGEHHYTLRLIPQKLESPVDNNHTEFSVEVKRALLRVLLVDGLPRWEFRYMRNALERDPNVQVEALLLESSHASHQSPEGFLSEFPASRDELAAYDVIVLGDIDFYGSRISHEQFQWIAEQVEKSGGGLIHIPGPRHRPAGIHEGPLASLSPVSFDPDLTGHQQLLPATWRLSESGKGHLLTLLDPLPGRNQNIWSHLPGFTWCTAPMAARPGSEVLAVHDTLRTSQGPLPLIATRLVGRGKVLFLGTDCVWRWRRGVEDLYHYRFWGQVVRWMSHQRHLLRGQGFHFTFAPETPVVGETLELLLHFHQHTNSKADDFKMEVHAPTGSVSKLVWDDIESDAGIFKSTYIPHGGGRHQFVLSGKNFPENQPLTFEVLDREVEVTDQPSRPENLNDVCVATGGKVFLPTEIENLRADLQRITAPIKIFDRLELWNHPAWMILLMASLGTYWSLRRWFGQI